MVVILFGDSFNICWYFDFVFEGLFWWMNVLVVFSFSVIFVLVDIGWELVRLIIKLYLFCIK